MQPQILVLVLLLVQEVIEEVKVKQKEVELLGVSAKEEEWGLVWVMKVPMLRIS